MIQEKIFFLVVILFFSSCEENKIPTTNTHNLLIGIWSNGIYNQKEETITYRRISDFPQEKYAMAFYEDNSFIEKTSGWCTTAPLCFFNVIGNYSLQNNMVSIRVNNDSNTYALQILSLSETALTVKRRLTTQKTDHQHLMKLFEEITNMANSKPCNNSNNWTFSAYGSKACGGPQGYIAYSTEIDVTSFLEKITQYTKAEAAYNNKWGVISTCDLPLEPSAVFCKNNTAVLKY